MKAFVRMLKRRVEAAAIWRQENREQSQSNREPQMADCGWVLFYRGEICGWTRDLHPNTAQGWQPGVLAVGVAGIDDPIYQATGGDEMHGATGWSSIWNPMPDNDKGRLVPVIFGQLTRATLDDGNGSFTDGRLDLEMVADPVGRKRIREWMDKACADLEIDAKVCASLKGVVFEIRQGYKSKDAKRQNGDIGNAATAYKKGYIPAVGLLSLQIDSDVEERYAAEEWVVLKGIHPGGSAHDSLYAFCSTVVGYDLAAFFERNQVELKTTLDAVLKKLLAPDGNPTHAPTK